MAFSLHPICAFTSFFNTHSSELSTYVTLWLSKVRYIYKHFFCCLLKFIFMHAIIIYRKVLCCHPPIHPYIHTYALLFALSCQTWIFTVLVCFCLMMLLTFLASLLFVARICIALAGIHWYTTTHIDWFKRHQFIFV